MTKVKELRFQVAGVSKLRFRDLGIKELRNSKIQKLDGQNSFNP
jgi:hypothetical protein